MRKLVVAWGVLLFTASAFAQNECEFASKEAAEKLEQALKSAPTCSKAAAILSRCRWGSSADVGFASIVLEKCEHVLLPKLTPNGNAHYRRERELCAYEYAQQQGSLSLSEAAICAVYVAERFTTKPELAEAPAPRASFDCAKARTTLENAVCTDDALGRADIVLDRAYRPLLREMPPEKRALLIKKQKAWCAQVEKKCGASTDPLTAATRECARKEFEARFAFLDGCSVGGPEECLFQLQSDNP